MRRRPVSKDDATEGSRDKDGSSRSTYPTVTDPPRGDEERRLENMIEELAGKTPPWLAELLRSLAPLMAAIVALINVIGPPVVEFYTHLFKAYQLLPKNVIGMIYGLVMCFFGGFFHVTIAALEAFNMTGGEKIYRCLRELKVDLDKVAQASEKDDSKDKDGDGVADTQQMDAEKFVTHKLTLALRVVDPDRVTNALTGLWQGYMGVLVVLKFRFAKVVTLAVSIGNHLRPIMAKFLGPSLASVMPKEYHQWIAPLINFLAKFIAMSLAWYVQRLISTVQSAIKGGMLFARSLLSVLTERTSIDLNPDNTFIDETIGWTLAVIGTYFQISSQWDLPWFVDLLLWPAYLLEMFLKWSVTWMDVDSKLD